MRSDFSKENLSILIKTLGNDLAGQLKNKRFIIMSSKFTIGILERLHGEDHLSNS